MKISKLTRLGSVAAIAGGLLATTALVAQTVPDDATPAANLDLPDNLQVFGKTDPNVRKPTAIVNNAVITGTDVDRRLAMVAALNNITVTSEEQRQQLRLQILRSLIDETLEIQAAKAHDITVSKGEIDQAYARLAKRFNKTPDELTDFLQKSGSSVASLRRQIEGELAWGRLLRQQVEPFVNVGDEEVQAILKRMEASKGTEEYHLKEIYLSANPSNEQQVYAEGQKMIQQMKQGAPFEYFARTYSEATTRAKNGDLGWVRPAMLPQQLAEAAGSMQIGQVAGPIQIPGGFSILYLVDSRQVLTADPRDARLSLRQLTINFPKGTTEAQAQAKAAEFGKVTQSMQGCGDVSNAAAKLNAEVVDNDQIRIRDLPPQLQEIMLKLKVGQATPPFGSPDQGVRVLVMCGRDDPKSASLPSADQIQSNLEQQRVNLRADRMLRDLRRDAIIEYR
ncbi:peptidylprolyl isomerase [Stakelama marina]|uniref:Parvulin-like PPIase n=1 Tax=Stakelama marina TaxID=2826939 RepID=A0A8T4IB36_9SPHN|nr:peptidylprolyl isomerase [Stakelama marina]MBR0551623.1 peptidylprolyl isomerase [Stakelama marina]